ncbi:MAG: phosphatidate cytidylyltransferase [Acidobacteriota bacterium]
MVKRLLTAAVGVPLSLLAVFKMPWVAFFLLCVLVFDWGAFEFVRLLRASAPHAPLTSLVALVPLAALAIVLALDGGPFGRAAGAWMVSAAALLSIGLSSLVLFSRTPVQEGLAALGILSFGIPYFALPIASITWLQRHNPWLVFLLCAIVWLGDTAALYFGSLLGKRRLAPVVSPKKSWEGALAGFLVSVIATAVWSYCQLGRIDGPLVAVGAVTAIAAQIGDLVESLLKRGVGVKDSGGVLPGHGGMFDRMDSMLFAGPTLLVGLWAVGFEGLPL